MCVYIYIYGSVHLIMDPSVHAKKNPGWDPFLRLSVGGAQIDLACKSAILERHAAFSPQVGLQQYTSEDKAAGSSERGRIHLPTQLVPVRIFIFFPPYLGPPSEFFFSVPGSPTHTGTVLNTSTAETHNDPKRGSERASRRKPIRQTVRYSYG